MPVADPKTALLVVWTLQLLAVRGQRGPALHMGAPHRSRLDATWTTFISHASPPWTWKTREDANIAHLIFPLPWCRGKPSSQNQFCISYISKQFILVETQTWKTENKYGIILHLLFLGLQKHFTFCPRQIKYLISRTYTGINHIRGLRTEQSQGHHVFSTSKIGAKVLPAKTCI